MLVNVVQYSEDRPLIKSFSPPGSLLLPKILQTNLRVSYFRCRQRLFIIASLFTQKALVCTYSKYCTTSPYTVNHWLHVWISVGLIIRSARHLRVWRHVCYMMLHDASLGLVLLSAYHCGIRAANHSRDCKQVDQ